MLQSIRSYVSLRGAGLCVWQCLGDGSPQEDRGCVARSLSLPLDEKPKRVFRTLRLV